jgi:hypothetical protein
MNNPGLSVLAQDIGLKARHNILRFISAEEPRSKPEKIQYAV